MGTVVSIRVVQGCAEAEPAIDRAFGWFHEIEACCTRFSPDSELMRLTSRTGEPVPTSAILFEAVRFALMVAEETNGAFDPTIGHLVAERGYNREYRTGNILPALPPDADVSYRCIELDPARRTILLRRALTLDLGAVAKGLAVDTAARELAPFENFSIDAGGDLYMAGLNAQGAPWSVGIRHPRRDGELIETLRVSNQAVCTSGDYERPHHIVDPRAGNSARTVASATVVAPGAMLADALATAAFVLGPQAGIDLLDRMGVEGLIVTPELERYETRSLCRAA